MQKLIDLWIYQMELSGKTGRAQAQLTESVAFLLPSTESELSTIYLCLCNVLAVIPVLMPLMLCQEMQGAKLIWSMKHLTVLLSNL